MTAAPVVLPFTRTEPSDDSLALLFSEVHRDNFRYVARWHQWFHWTENRWQRDSILSIYNSARELCRSQITDATPPRVAAYLSRADTVSAVEQMARSDRRHVATVDQWDRDPWLLGTPTCTVDLRTGVPSPPNHADYITKQTAVAPDFTADCPLWLTFLDRVTLGDRELQHYLQRLIGYCLTGVTREQMFAFLYGTGANGKGVFLNTLTTVLGDYGHVTPMDMFEASRNERHPTELACLQGARLVTAQETEEGRRFAESRIKALTGSDPITARYMRQDFFTFTPQFKLLIAGNHKPSLRNVDEAMRRRLHLVPFEASILFEERDPNLTSKLIAEHSAILAWAIRGCLAWQANGLVPPERVRAATEEYFASQDSFAVWLSERTRPASRAVWESSAELFASWRAWADSANEHVGDTKSFAEALRRKGFESARHPQSRKMGWRGLELIRRNPLTH